MSRLLPHPLLSAGLVAAWLLLNGLAPGSLVLAGFAGLTIPLAMRALRPEPVRVRRPFLLLRLIGLVLYDMVRSNFAVARIILAPRRDARPTGLVTIPLDLRAPFALTLLSIILTDTPGTLWVRYESGSGCLHLHVLDDADPQEWVARVKDRYERPLMEIFG